MSENQNGSTGPVIDMQRKKSRASVPNIGSSLLLVIFLILCLVMFATLSVTTARSNYRISQREADRVTAKTAADNASQQILAALPSLCTRAVTASAETITTTAGDIPVAVTPQENGHTVFSWQISFSDTQAIAVAVDLASLDAPGDYTITRWQTIKTTDWSSTDTIRVMTP